MSKSEGCPKRVYERIDDIRQRILSEGERDTEKSERLQGMTGTENGLKTSDCMRLEDEEGETSTDTSHSERAKYLLSEREEEEKE